MIDEGTHDATWFQQDVSKLFPIKDNDNKDSLLLQGKSYEVADQKRVNTLDSLDN